MKEVHVILILMSIPVVDGFGQSSATHPVKITAEVKSNVFSYQIENWAERGILGIRIPQHGTYFYTHPDGWEEQVEGEMLHLWTDKLSRSIRPGDTGQFSMRVSSAGAVLGKRQVTVELEGGQTLAVSDVWVPVHEPIGSMWLVAGCLLAILLAHTAGSRFLGRRGSSGQFVSKSKSDNQTS